VSAGTAACVGFVVESGVRVSAKDHATCVECDAVVRVCCAVIEQVMDVFFYVLGGVCFASGDGVEGGQYFIVYGTRIIE